jgi:hypothetical protein
MLEIVFEEKGEKENNPHTLHTKLYFVILYPRSLCQYFLSRRKFWENILDLNTVFHFVERSQEGNERVDGIGRDDNSY